jgi:hypothetical protein
LIVLIVLFVICVVSAVSVVKKNAVVFVLFLFVKN